MKVKILIIFLVLLIVILAVVVFGFSKSLLNEGIETIEIKDGTTGILYTLKSEKKDYFIDSFIKMNSKIRGINIWSSGYSYKIETIAGKKRNEILVMSENDVKSWIFKYEMDGDVIKLIEEIIQE